MKNKEKKAEEIIEMTLDGKGIALNIKTMQLYDCDEIECNNCYFSQGNYPIKGNCWENRKHWANSEYVEPKEFTKQEKALIRALDKVKWVARDRDGDIYGYINPPTKNECAWNGRWAVCFLRATSCEFKAIKWEDKEPTSREEILRGEK